MCIYMYTSIYKYIFIQYIYLYAKNRLEKYIEMSVASVGIIYFYCHCHHFGDI